MSKKLKSGTRGDEEIEDEVTESQSTPDERLQDISVGEHCLTSNDITTKYIPKQGMQYIPGHGLSRYHNALKNLIPVRPKEKKKETMPVDSAGLFSFLTFSWISKYMWAANRKGIITLEDLPAVSPYDACDYNAQRLELLWQDELNRKGPEGASFTMTVWKFVRTRIYVSCFLFTCNLIFGFISPIIFMRKLLEYVQSSEENVWNGIKWALLLMISDLFRAIFFAWTWATNYRTALRLRSACLVMLYRKIIRLNSLETKSIGELINMFSNDGHRVFDMILFGPMAIGGPIVTVCGIVYILWLLSPIALLGIIAFLLFYPTQFAISRLTGYFRLKAVKVSDTRIRLMNEILECIKLIKMYVWEKYFSRDLLDVRQREQSLLLKSAYCQSLSISLAPAVPIISTMITFLAHVSTGNNLTAAEAFPISTFFGNRMKNALSNMKDSTQSFVDARIAFRRFKSVLLLEDGSCHVSKPIVKSQAIAINHGTFVRKSLEKERENPARLIDKKKRKTIRIISKDNEEKEILNKASREMKQIEILIDITFEVAKGKLVGICGHVGSGKSSLLLAALGQLQMSTGCIMRDGSCAYVSQQAWIINATFRENILFGEPFEPRRYYETLFVCSLNQDLNVLPGGDRAEIGERGVNLSGGQKQRISLARALYSDRAATKWMIFETYRCDILCYRDIYFLDDPLSAVDVHVGSHIFENLILGALRKKTVLFVTHQIQRCDDIYMIRNGKIVEHGTHEELTALDKEYAFMAKTILAETENNFHGEEQIVEPLRSDQETIITVNNKLCTVSTGSQINANDKEKVEETGTFLMAKEKIERGTIKMQTYHAYVQAAGGYFIACVVIATFLLNVGSTTFSSWWLAAWLNAGGGNTLVTRGNVTVLSDNINDNPAFSYYQTIYCICIGTILATSLLRGFVITRATIRASTVLHNKLFKKIMNCPVRFFETTPSGRVQNIFSRDLDELDNRLPVAVESTIQNILILLFAVLSVCLVFPWFTLPLIFLAVLFYSISKVFRVALRDLKRMENVSRSPIFSFIATTVQGLGTIHAFEKENDFITKFEEMFDVNSSCLFLCNIATRWLIIRFDVLVVMSTCITAFLIIALKGQVHPAMAGLALSYCALISGVFQYVVRLMSETEVRFISAEKVNYYLKTLESEGQSTGVTIKPHDNWPVFGKIKFKGVQMKYRKDLSLALSDVSITIEAGEKIGIVGKTGSGKSSLTVALFRLVELSGGIIQIDGVDISKMSLESLRNKLSIIPQDPVLFSGTIRSNLDPFKMCTDLKIWEVLEKVKLKNRVQSVAAQLDTPVGFGGHNLSVGERQLLCLARALLRRNKILILDEATAAIDPETEVAVQSTIQQDFADCTVLTIAHRLQTVVSCDRILVMDNARILEFDTPLTLLANSQSEFAKMMAATETAIKRC